MDLSRIEELEQLEKEATPGPWGLDPSGFDDSWLFHDESTYRYIDPTEYQNAILLHALRNAAPELLDAAKKWVELESEEDSEAWYTKKMKYAEAKVAALEAENARLTALVREAKEWFSTVCGETYPWPKEGTWEKRAEAELEGK